MRARHVVGSGRRSGMRALTLVLVAGLGCGMAACSSTPVAQDEGGAEPINTGLSGFASRENLSAKDPNARALAKKPLPKAVDADALRSAVIEVPELEAGAEDASNERPATRRAAVAKASEGEDIDNAHEAASDVGSPVNAGLGRLAGGTPEPTRPTKRAAAAIDRAAATEPGAEPAPDLRSAEAAWERVAVHGGITTDAQGASAGAIAGSSITNAALDGLTSDDQQFVVLASSLARFGAASMLPDALVLAPIERLRPGTLASLEQDDSLLHRTLPGEEFRSILGARDRVASDRSAGETTAASATASLASILPAGGFRLGYAGLCSRVYSYGRFDPMGTDLFVAGKPIRALVYVEVDGFTNKDAGDGMKQVELSQSLTLYHDADGLEMWSRAAKSVSETSRNPRRDFFLVQEVELPRNLSVGKYSLKVRVEDKATGAQAEATIPISVVAQAR